MLAHWPILVGFSRSWHNSTLGQRIIGRLDRILCNQDWLGVLAKSVYEYKAMASSDHSPILLHLLRGSNSGPNHLSSSTIGFNAQVLRNWLSRHGLYMWGTPKFQVTAKLKEVKKAIKLWIKEDCINTKAKLINVSQQLQATNEALKDSPTGPH